LLDLFNRENGLSAPQSLFLSLSDNRVTVKGGAMPKHWLLFEFLYLESVAYITNLGTGFAAFLTF